MHRTLAALLDSGIAHAVPASTGTAYGLADHPHLHAICRDCGTVVELHGSLRLDSVLVPEGFRTDGLTLHGACRACEPSGRLGREPSVRARHPAGSPG